VPATAITAFEVPPEADEPFVAAWEPHAGATLHRALREDADFRFVEVAEGDIDAFELPRFRSHPGRYEVAHEDGAPDGAGGVVLINPFEVPAEADDRFVEGWSRARELLAGQRGYLGTRLHRSLGPADFRFVNVARWSSPLAFARAVQQPGFQQMAAIGFRAHPALYLAVATPRAGAGP
jgi:heme-degrading monooxygenase HmoA